MSAGSLAWADPIVLEVLVCVCVCMCVCVFADDLAAVSTTRMKIEESAFMLHSVLREWGLTMSMTKTKLLIVGSDEVEDLRPLEVDSSEVECVSEFKYLGSLAESRGGIVKEVGERIAKASRAFGALRKAVFRDNNLSHKTKRLVYKAAVLGVLLYGSET